MARLGVTEGDEEPLALAHTADDGCDTPTVRLERDRVKALVRGSLFGRGTEPVRIGRFDVLRKLGSGGMGVVYSAFDDELDRKVAIKLMRVDRRQAKGRLLREAQAIARLSHPNVAVVYEVGEHRGQLFVAMEFVRGVTLRDWLEASERSWREILDVFLQAGAGLAAAHAAGLVHRDFKPENVMVGDPGGAHAFDSRVRVLDFGLAAVVGAGVEESGVDVRSDDAAPDRLTVTGALLGTPAYMAPEQLAGNGADPRSDQFSFCVALWEALFGKRPFAGDTLEALTRAVTEGPRPVPPSLPGLPAQVQQALLQGLSVAPEQRFRDMPALLHDLAVDPAARRRHWLLAVMAIGLVVAASAAGYFAAVDHDADCEDAATHLAPVWDELRRDAAQAALARADGNVSLGGWARTATALDDYTAQWSEVYARTCRATDVAEEQRLERQLCLQWMLDSLRPLTDDLVAGEPTAVDIVPERVAALPAPSQCETELQLQQLRGHRAASTPDTRTILSDFEGDAAVVGGGGWTVSTDRLAGGDSEAHLELAAGGHAQSQHALRIHGIIRGDGPPKWGGAMMFPGKTAYTPVNLSAKKSLRFWVRGTVERGHVLLFTVRAGFNPAIRPFPVTAEWTEVVMPLRDFDEELYDVTAIFWGSIEDGPFELLIDDVGLD